MGRTVEQDLRTSVRACWVAAATMAALVAPAGLLRAGEVTRGVRLAVRRSHGRGRCGGVVRRLVRQGTGDYFVAWMTAGAMCLLPAAMCLSIPRLSSDGTDEEGGGTPKASSEETAQI